MLGMIRLIAFTVAALSVAAFATPVELGGDARLSQVVRVAGEYGNGTGFVVNGGLVVTARHVVEDTDTPTIQFENGTEKLAFVLARANEYDIAVIAVPSADHAVPASLDCRASRLGEPVSTVGHPFGLPYVLTTGIVASDRPFRDGTIILEMVINPGNSGGPVFAADGRVIGLIDGAFNAGRSGLGTMIGSPAICDFLGGL